MHEPKRQIFGLIAVLIASGLATTAQASPAEALRKLNVSAVSAHETD